MTSIFQKGKFFYDKEQYTTAIEYFTQSCKRTTESKEDKAQSWYKLAIMVRNGHGSERNIHRAIECYRQSADLGFAPAMFSLGYLYDKGSHVPQDLKQAIAWYKKGAELGHTGCQINLAMMYDSGTGMKKNDKQAFYWFNEAAKQGDIDAMYNIGIMYQDGQYVEQDSVKANAYFCNAGEYNFLDNIDSCEIVSSSDLDTCPYNPNDSKTSLLEEELLIFSTQWFTNKS